jgi:hypothetical protein
MSTRCNIIIADADCRLQLYRHHDGYPDSCSGVLATLEKASPFAWSLPRFEADDFAAALVRAWKQENGGNIAIDGSPVDWELIHGDVEWVYLIQCYRNFDEPTVTVYDWHSYCFGEVDPNKVTPQPMMTMPLTATHEIGLMEAL